MKIEEKTIYESEKFKLNAQIFKSEHNNKLGTLIYYHGGGLIFGRNDDLPNAYIEILTEKFDVVAVNYRLIPESTLQDILQDIEKTYQFAKNLHEKVYVFGRSAGGFLSYLTAKHYDVKGAIIMYGYYNFNHPDFKELPKDQKKYKTMLNESIEKMNVRHTITTEENPNPRFLLYLYYRNENNWIDKMQVDVTNDKYFLTEHDLKNMPQTFLVHDKGDPDVPFDYSKIANQLIPNNKMITLDLNDHDFDRNVTSKSISIYKQAINFFK